MQRPVTRGAAAALLVALAALSPPSVAAASAAAVRALDCDRLSAGDVREVLATAPAPRIIAISGSLGFGSMDSFARYLAAMGYPADRIRNPADGRWSYSSAVPSAELAGMLAWHYEHDGTMPLLIGYSGGGNLVMRTLHELAGEFSERLPVFDPMTGEALARDTIVDPVTGRARPVVGLKVPYAAAIATGKLPRVVLGQWTMLSRVRRVPDTAEEFTGLTIEWDAIAGTFPGSEPYAATGSAQVRNVTLPASYSHVDLPRTEHLAADPVTRAWIESYRPDAPAPLPGTGADTTNLLHAADVWHSVAKHWCIAAQAQAARAN